LTAAAVTALLIGRTFTDGGHLLAVVIGFACYPLTRDPAVSERARAPIWSPLRDIIPPRSSGDQRRRPH
jgi:hypothetical protein